MKLSIIIPTLNEEKYLPGLLSEIERQNFKDYEIIVADAGSKDRTVEIAKKFGAKAVRGRLPAVGRNKGACAARGDLFLFVEADTSLPERFLENSLEEFVKNNFGVATFRKVPNTDKTALKLIIFIYNLIELVVPIGGMVILAKKEIHEKLGGFNEAIKLGEDTDYLWRARRLGVFGTIKSTKFLMSMRRFETEGFLKTTLKYVAAGLYFLVFGFPKSDIFKYKFGHYKEKM